MIQVLVRSVAVILYIIYQKKDKRYINICEKGHNSSGKGQKKKVKMDNRSVAVIVYIIYQK